MSAQVAPTWPAPMTEIFFLRNATAFLLTRFVRICPLSGPASRRLGEWEGKGRTSLLEARPGAAPPAAKRGPILEWSESPRSAARAAAAECPPRF
jgi:hypothetical protein